MGNESWTFPVMFEVILRLQSGDSAAVAIAIDMVEEDDFFYFGRRIKCCCAYGLRRARLTEEQQQRIRVRIVAMLLSGWVPREFAEYKRLLRKVGMGDLWPLVEAHVDRTNRHVMRAYDYLNRFVRDIATEDAA